MAEDGNGRVTIAVLGQKLDTIEELLRDQCRLQAADHDRIGNLEGELRRVNDRIGAFQAAQGLLTLIASTFAGWLGTRQ
jgi:hypothetical protein